MAKAEKPSPPGPPPPPKNPPPPPPPPIQVKKGAQSPLKPFHWEKVKPINIHSMVWDMLSIDGSFCLDGDLMEALFSNAATNSPPHGRSRESSDRIFILDPRKSQNIAIVLRSLAISRQQILDALLEGRGLDTENLEKLHKVAPSKEEETKILEFNGDRTKLADAESFLFSILEADPHAFTLLGALLFRSNYDREIQQVKESVHILELACNELKKRGIFVKLLEAILKTGNLMNAGTSRGNALAFNLRALPKLSDVKSTNGKITLLHFVIEEVARYEGKHFLMKHNHDLGKIAAENEQRRIEYIKLGLPVVRGLGAEFSNVKKAARIDYDGFAQVCPTLSARVAEISQFLGQPSMIDRGGFVRDMKGFLEVAKKEIEVVEEEQTRVLLLLKRTKLFYQSGASKSEGASPLEIFGILKDFLDMVDRACIDIGRYLQKMENVGSASPARRAPVRFQNLPEHFSLEKSSPGASPSRELDGGG